MQLVGRLQSHQMARLKDVFGMSMMTAHGDMVNIVL